MNLLEETLGEMARHDLTPKDVLCVLNGSQKGSWADFAVLADFGYDDGYGSQKISPILMIVGKDWWFERAEYDGSEWWVYKTYPNTELYSESLTNVHYGE